MFSPTAALHQRTGEAATSKQPAPLLPLPSPLPLPLPADSENFTSSNTEIPNKKDRTTAGTVAAKHTRATPPPVYANNASFLSPLAAAHTLASRLQTSFALCSSSGTTPASADSSTLTDGGNSSSNSSMLGSAAPADSSSSSSSSFLSPTHHLPSPFTSPLQPHHLSFDADHSTPFSAPRPSAAAGHDGASSSSSSAMGTLTPLPLAPFAFASSNSGGSGGSGSNLSPPMQSPLQPSSSSSSSLCGPLPSLLTKSAPHGALQIATSRKMMLPLTINAPHSAGSGTGNTGGSGSASSGNRGHHLPPHHHHRSSSSSELSIPLAGGSASSTSNNGAGAAQLMMMRRTRTPQLNTKRHRGSSMDLEAERESGATLFSAFSSSSSSSAAAAAAAALSSSASLGDAFDPRCPALALTHSMRKLRVKKSADSTTTRDAGLEGGASTVNAVEQIPEDMSDDEQNEQQQQQQQPQREQQRSSSLPHPLPPSHLALPQAPTFLGLSGGGGSMSARTPLRVRRVRAQSSSVDSASSTESSEHLLLGGGGGGGGGGAVISTPLQGPYSHNNTPSSGSPAFRLRVCIPDSDERMRHSPPPVVAAAAATGPAPLQSPPAAHRVSKALSWDSDDDEEEGEGAPTAPSSAGSVLHSRPLMATQQGFSSSSSSAADSNPFQLRLASAAAAMRSTNQQGQVGQDMPLLSEDDVSGVATVLDFGGAADDDEDDHADDEVGDRIGAGMRKHSRLLRRASSVFLSTGANNGGNGGSYGALVLAPDVLAQAQAQQIQIMQQQLHQQQQIYQQFQLQQQQQLQQQEGGGAYTPTAAGAASRSNSFSASRFSPIPHHTPLTPTASNFPGSPLFSASSLGMYGVSHATPLPLLPSMRMPESRLPEDLAAAAAEAVAKGLPPLRLGAAAASASGLDDGPCVSPTLASSDSFQLQLQQQQQLPRDNLLPPGMSELDFMSPVNTGAHHLFFPPSQSPTAAADTEDNNHGADEWMTERGSWSMTEHPSQTTTQAAQSIQAGLIDASSMERPFSVHLERAESNNNNIGNGWMGSSAPTRVSSLTHSASSSEEGSGGEEGGGMSTPPPHSPPPSTSAASSNRLSLPGPSTTTFSLLLSALSPDPKAFQESSSLQPKINHAAHTPMRLGFGGGGVPQHHSSSSSKPQPHAITSMMMMSNDRSAGGGGNGMLGSNLMHGGGLGSHHQQQQKTLQPPPTPVRPSSIKRIRASERGGNNGAGRGGMAAAGTSTPARLSSHATAGVSSSIQNCSGKLLAAALGPHSLDSPPSTSSSFGGGGLFGTAAASSSSSSLSLGGPPPTILPPCHSRTRLERASSLHDNKVLIDFTAHLAAARAAKRDARRRSGGGAGSKGGEADQNESLLLSEEDSMMNDSCIGESSVNASPDTSYSKNGTPVEHSSVTPAPSTTTTAAAPFSISSVLGGARAAAHSGATSAALPSPSPLSPPCIGVPGVQQAVSQSIWDTRFTNKVLVGRGSFFETFRCQSLDRGLLLGGGCTSPTSPSSPSSPFSEYGQFFAVKRSLKPFRGKKDRGIYLREIALMESLGQHENIVRHIRAWQEDMHFFVQMEYCPLNLSEYVSSLHATQDEAAAAAALAAGLPPPASSSLLSDALLKNLTLQLASALAHIHARGLIHLDVKPENVLVSFDGIVRLADFGQARLLRPMDGSTPPEGGGSGPTLLHMCPDFDMDGIEGDSVYMAPELLDPSGHGGLGPSSACDIFSLGLTLVELSSGATLPKSGPIWRDLREGRAVKHIHHRVSKCMEHVILNLLEPSPAKRPSAKQIVEWVRSHQDEQDTTSQAQAEGQQ